MEKIPYIEEALEKWDNAAAYTLAVMDSMPAEHYGFKPTEEQMTFQRQVVHSLRQMTRFPAIFFGAAPFARIDEIPDQAMEMSKEELRALAVDCFAYTRQVIASMTADDLEKTVEDFWAGPKSRRQIVKLLDDHLTHHRAQMIIYLRLKGEKPPQYIGW
jgi:uncharacterized damage-inducible protein DinB